MNFTSIEISRLLYELTRWEDTYAGYESGAELRVENELDSVYEAEGWVMDTKYRKDIPAYSLGYLLRKLPAGTDVGKASDALYLAHIGSQLKQHQQKAGNPEDALALLAINLIEKGVLK